MQQCPVCMFENPPDFSFCGRCGSSLRPGADPRPISKSENALRKYLTVVFTDLTGYTALCEVLDPEEVKGLMGKIFAHVQGVVESYEGVVSKLLGDSALILFGFPRTHEDDVSRALRAAMEIHAGVQELNPDEGSRLSAPLRMHTGVNTGLAVLHQAGSGKTAREVTGDTVNVASRLCMLAGAGEILMGSSTYRQAAGLFHCSAPGSAMVKGKASPVEYYRLISLGDEPHRTRQTHVRKADFVGRHDEMRRLQQALKALLAGGKVLVEICGAAGSGKTRLVDELKAGLDLEAVEWRQGAAYAYRSNTPYYPLIDLLKNLWGLKENDSFRQVKTKVESGCFDLLGGQADLLPYIGCLFSLEYPELEKIGPETWQARFLEAFEGLLTRLSRGKPLIICLEDAHWADQESLDLLARLFKSFELPILWLCVYRDDFNLWSPALPAAEDIQRFMIKTEPLSKSDTLSMLGSLLGGADLPEELKRFIGDRIEGNPFYLTEVVNSLIESGLLVELAQGWRTVRRMTEEDVPFTIHGLLSARIDRLDQACRQVLQEASVFGRSFLLPVLRQVSSCSRELEKILQSLKEQDFIHKSSDSREQEWLFSHALAQEVVYSSVLKSDRRAIHRRIALTMEELFAERLPEFSETLAFHFKRAGSTDKAVAYLAKSGEKSLSRHALDQAQAHYQEAFDLLRNEPDGYRDLEIAILNQWAFVYYYRGRFKELLDLLLSFEDRARDIENQAEQGLFFAWMGCALWHRERFSEAFQCLIQALETGKRINNQRLTGYACTWLIWTCTDLGRLSEAREYAAIAQKSYETGAAEFFVFFNSLAGLGYTAWHSGDKEQALAIGRKLIELGVQVSDNRCTVMGYCCLGWGWLTAGDHNSATRCFQTAVNQALDPWYALIPKLALCYGLISNGRIDEAECFIRDILQLSQEYGVEFVGTPARFFHGVVLAAGGKMLDGLREMQQTLDFWEKNHCRLRYASCCLVLARIYSLALRRGKRGGPGMLRKTAGILFRTFAAGKRARDLLEKCIAEAGAIRADGVLAQAYLEQGRLYAYLGKRDQARESLHLALERLQACQAEHYLQQAEGLIEEIERQGG